MANELYRAKLLAHAEDVSTLLDATSQPIQTFLCKRFDLTMYPLDWIKGMITDLEQLAPPSSPVADSPTDSEMFDWLEIALYGKTGNTWEVGRMSAVLDVLRKIRASAPSASAGGNGKKDTTEI